MTYRMSILPYQSHPLMIIERDHSYCSWMLEILPGDQGAARRDHLILDILGDPALSQHRGRLDGPAQLHIGQLLGAENRPRWSSSTGSRVASLRSSAASTRPTKSGCGLVGRDLSSGCAWVATKYGWISLGNSMNSTSLVSGEVPLITRPASSSRSRYALFTS